MSPVCVRSTGLRRGATAAHHAPMAMSEAAAGELCRLLDAHGLDYWVIGGWGVDALIGRGTRAHKDLDLLLPLSQHARTWRLLHDHQFSLQYRWDENVDVPGELLPGAVQPTAYVLEDPIGRQLDVHVVDDRSPAVRPLWATDQQFVAGALEAEGHIDGMRVRCMSAQMQLLAHEGYELPATQQADVVLLRSLLDRTCP